MGESDDQAQAGDQPPNPQDAAPPARQEPASVADGLPKKLDPRYVHAETLSGWVSTAVISGLSPPILFIVWLAGGLPNWAVVLAVILWPLLTALLIWLTLRQPRWVYHHTRYVVRPDGVEIHQGIFWKRIITVPRARVQHTDVSQGPVLRRFGLATLTMYTAGTHHSAVLLSGVSHETAIRIRDFLLHRGESHAA